MSLIQLYSLRGAIDHWYLPATHLLDEVSAFAAWTSEANDSVCLLPVDDEEELCA
jgi:hypothetical protein